MNIAGWIDREIVTFTFVIFAEKFAVKRFEEIVFVKTAQFQIDEADTQMDRRAERLGKQSDELMAKRDDFFLSNRSTKKTHGRAIVLQRFAPNFDVTVQLRRPMDEQIERENESFT